MAELSNEIVDFFHKHLVPIFFSFRREDDVQNAVITTFVLSVNDKWFLATAGHCIKEIEELTEVHGYKISQCKLIDAMGDGAKYIHPIPFVYEDANPTCISDDYDFDYGFIEISPYYRQLLLANNVEPLNEQVWKKQPKTVDFYGLIGIPEELVKVNPDSLELNPIMFTIEQLIEKPDGFGETEIPLFYGKIGLGGNINSIKGVSGGPIFGFFMNENGEMRYWLTALQSRWLPESHYISACPAFILGDVLEDLLSVNSNQQQSGGPTPR